MSTREATGDFDRAIQLALAARAAGVEVALFFMDHAVAALPTRGESLDALREQNCDFICCGTSAHELGLSESDVGMFIGGQNDHAALVQRADRTVAFT